MVAHDRSELSMIKRRMEAAFLIFLLAIMVLALRLGYLQWARAKDFARLAEKMQGRVFEIDARRGRIEDRNGNPFAIDTLAKAIVINPRIVKQSDATAARIASLLGLPDKDRDDMAERIAAAKLKKSAYLKLRRGVERKKAEHLFTLASGKQSKEAKPDPLLRGIWLEDTPVRSKPSGLDAGQMIGDVNIDGVGIEGLEMKFDSVLRGRNGQRRVNVDASGKPVPGSADHTTPPVDGKNIRLTLDRDIQHMVEAEIQKVGVAQSADAATAIVLDVKTGQVLGMANYPAPKAGQKTVTAAQRRNRAITDLYEPGSIFKVVTGAAALEAGVSTNCYCGGSRAIGNRRVACHGISHGPTPLGRMIEQSCNLAAGALAERVGPKRFYDYLDKFGFISKTGIEFPGEIYAKPLPPEKWRTMRTVNIGFGQGIQVSPIQMAAFYAAIANDGVYNPPTLLHDGTALTQDKRIPRRIVTVENARELRKGMERVVTAGTGKNAKAPGYSCAGKTGTAQMVVNGRYSAFMASFVGYAPATKPKLAILVSVWHPRRGHYGGAVSAPVFREIARKSLDFLGVPPDTPEDLSDVNKVVISSGGD